MKKLKRGKKPETILQDRIVAMLKLRDWYCRETHGNMYQSGFPDIFSCHRRYGIRWIEVKVLPSYSFTSAQMDVFPEFSGKGVGIWILTEATEFQYKKLFQPPNWHTFLSIMK